MQDSIFYSLSAKRLKSNDFTWFDIHRYREASQLTLAEWGRALSHRLDGFCGLRNKGLFLLSDAELVELLKDPFVNLREEYRPTRRTGERAESINSYPSPVIDDASISDLLQAVIQYRPEKLVEVIEDLQLMQHASSGRDVVPHTQMKIINRSIRSFEIIGDAPSSLPVVVDLWADDDLIINQFKLWLAGVRADFGALPCAKSWSDLDRKKWVEFGVLPYIDLVLFSNRIAHGRASQALLGSLLFPDETDVDVTERVRKTTHPLAERLLDAEFISTLMRRLDFPEQN